MDVYEEAGVIHPLIAGQDVDTVGMERTPMAVRTLGFYSIELSIRFSPSKLEKVRDFLDDLMGKKN